MNRSLKKVSTGSKLFNSYSNLTTGAVTIASGVSGTNIVSLDLGNVRSGQSILVNSQCIWTCGSLTGLKQLDCLATGSATYVTYNNSTGIFSGVHNIVSGTAQTMSLAGIIYVTGSGTMALTVLGLNLDASSSNSTITNGGGQISASLFNRNV